MAGRIAAVIVCHDLGRTLLEAVTSVERQTRPAAEIVVVDDHSTDIYTRQLLSRLQRSGTRIAQADGRGASAARNLGAQLTSAEYVVWLDGDDVLEPEYFEAAASRLDAEPELDFVSCAMRAFEGARYVWKPAPPTFVDAISTGGVPHASTMLRRRLWQTVGGFDESLRSFELLDFWASAIERGFHGLILDEPLLNYRVRPGSGYRRSIQRDVYQARLRHFYDKHRLSVEHHALELIEGKEAFLVSQRQYCETLEARKASLAAELTRLRHEIADATRALEARGLSRVDWGDLGRVTPLSQQWGRDRGTSIDRHYIEHFLDKHRADVRGRVLEVRDPAYTQRFGGGAVTASDVVDIDSGNGLANVVADLCRADGIPSGTYDCIILTQTLQLVDDLEAALAECTRILKPGGVLLVTAPCVIRVDDEAGRDGDFWRLTEASARRLFAAAFPLDAFDVTAYGNVKACSAFLYGISAEEMAPADLDHVDPNFPVVIAVRAVKPVVRLKPDTTTEVDKSLTVVGSGFSRISPVRLKADRTSTKAAILCYHRIAELTPDSHSLCVPPDVFREHMAYVHRECSPIALDELVLAAAEGNVPERAVAVTLDDGYLDALTIASPILAELGVPATFFVNTDRLNEEHERWWDIFERIFSCGGTLPPVLTLNISNEELRLPTSAARDRKETLDALNRTMWPLNATGRARVVADVLAWSTMNGGARPSHRVLTGEELRTLASRPGHTVGAHTVHHLALTTQALETKREEILEDKRTLERELKRPVDLFSYPYGDFDAETRVVVAEAQFKAAVTVEPGAVTAGSNRLLLPRFEVTSADHGGFPRRLQEIFQARS